MLERHRDGYSRKLTATDGVSGWVLVILHVAAYGAISIFLPGGIGAPFFAVSLAALLIWISVVDFLRFEIPDVASLLVICLAVLALVGQSAPFVVDRLIAGAGLPVLMWSVAKAYRHARGHHGLGFGDVKLGVGIGLLTGLQGSALVLSTAALSALGTLLIVALLRGRTLSEIQNTGIAFGPFLCLCTWAIWRLEAMA